MKYYLLFPGHPVFPIFHGSYTPNYDQIHKVLLSRFLSEGLNI
jgi:hypothetical protein